MIHYFNKKRKPKKIILVIILLMFFVFGCGNESTSSSDNLNETNNRQCSMGEQNVDGMCCRYMYKYPNKDGSCPHGYDDYPPTGGNRNVCWKESCH